MAIESWISFEAGYLWPVALGVCAAATVLMAWLYGPQIRGGGWGGYLTLGMRWLALTVLAAALLRPVVLQSGESASGRGVEVLLDCSKSMGVVDTGRTIPQQVAVAAALGQLPEGARQDVGAGISQLIRHAENLARAVINAQSDLEFARVVGRGVNDRQAALRSAVDRYRRTARELASHGEAAQVGSELRAGVIDLDIVPEPDQRQAWTDLVDKLGRLEVVVANSQETADQHLYDSDAQVREVCSEIARESRLQLAEKALIRPGGLAEKLVASGSLSAYAIDQELKPVALDKRSGGLANFRRLRAGGKGSNLTSAVSAAEASASDRSVRAIVLFSDGRQTGRRGDVVSGMRPSGVPVYTVAMAAKTVSDAWISNVTLPLSAFAGEMVEGQVEVRRQNLNDAPNSVTIETSTGSQLVRLQPRLQNDGKPSANDFTAHFTIPIDPPGGAAAERVRISIEPVIHEVSKENNHIERWVKVISAKLRVVAISGGPTWDFQFMQQALSGRPWVRLDTRLMDPAHPKLNMPAQELLTQDVVILHDVPVDGLELVQWDALRRLVSERGGSVIVIPGSAGVLADWDRNPFAAALLPFHDARPTWKQWAGEQAAFHFAPTPLGEGMGLRLGEGADSLHRWQELPAVYRFLQIPDKNLYSDVGRLLTETDSGSTVLIERRVVLGRIYLLGLDEIWRWRMKSGERDVERFWRQLIRAAAGEVFAVSHSGVALDIDRVECQPGEAVGVKARVRGALTALSASAKTLPLRIRSTGVVRTLNLTAHEGKFVGTVSGLPEGDYQLEITANTRAGRDDVVAVPLHVISNDEGEMQNLSGDPELLRRIARSSGGLAFPIESVDRLPQALEATDSGESQTVRRPLYQSPLLFVFVLACLSGEWALRKRLGLA
jgi:hypothetical protein